MINLNLRRETVMINKFVSKRFIQAVHNILGEFGYEDTDNLDFELIRYNAIDLLNHTRNLNDAVEVCRMFWFLLRYRKEVQTIFLRQSIMYKAMEFDHLKIIKRCPSKEAYGVYFISNAMTLSPDELLLSSASFYDRAIRFGRRNDGAYTVTDDGDYYMKLSQNSVLEAEIYSAETGEPVCKVVADEDFNFRLKNNRSGYYMVTDDDYIGFYDMDYIEYLREGEIIDTDRLVADMEWGVADDCEEYSTVNRLSLFDVGDDASELIFLLSAAVNLIYRRYMKSLNPDGGDREERDNLPYTEIGNIGRYFN